MNVTEDEFKQFYFSILSNRRKAIDKGIGKHTKDLHRRIISKLRSKGYDSYTKILQLFEKQEERDINSVVVESVMERYNQVLNPLLAVTT